MTILAMHEINKSYSGWSFQNARFQGRLLRHFSREGQRRCFGAQNVSLEVRDSRPAITNVKMHFLKLSFLIFGRDFQIVIFLKNISETAISAHISDCNRSIAHSPRRRAIPATTTALSERPSRMLNRKNTFRLISRNPIRRKRPLGEEIL